MSLKKPPKDASVENLLELCEVLREGKRTRKELTEAVDQSEDLVRDNLRFGVALGFITEIEDSFKTSSRGVEASYNQTNSGELAEQFQQGLSEYQTYRIVLKELAEEDFSADASPITKSDVLRVFRTSVGFEGSESTLGDRATTFIQTLEKAGLGEYVVGRRGKESRLEIGEEFDTLVGQVLDDGDESEQALEKSEETKSEKEPSAEVVKSPDSTTSKEAPFQIKLELSGDEDPGHVEDLIVGVRRGLTRNLNQPGVDHNEESIEAENEENVDDGNEEEVIDSNEENGSEDESDSESSDESLKPFVNSELVEEG
jgi:hypothetical protein